jgi:tetratricopeptide (TPR) repeat protein
LPPPPPRTCFGRDEFIEKLIIFAGNLEPIALIGAGGIGKTSIALAVLHHGRIKGRFCDNRRFIRCDQFPPSLAHFLARLSKVIGAGIENPEDLTPLRPFLSSQEIFIVLDNAESILDPQGPDAQKIYEVVDELCQFQTISLCITSRITTVPRYCKRPGIPTLTSNTACDIFYSIHGGGGQSSVIEDLLRRLDFHALSITLLATTASHNGWDYDELAKEWDTHRAQVLRTDFNQSLAATIELSLASPTFQKLGPNARDLLGVVAFFPQGVDEKNLDWFFPTIPDRKDIFCKFRVLSLTHRNNSFITMLAPIRDYLRPQDSSSSPLLCAAKECYFRRLSVDVDPGDPGFGEARWIESEDVNVEHLLNVFTSIDTDADEAWDACSYFMGHLYWHKRRPMMLGPKIEGLPDNHRSKRKCLSELSRLFQSVGNPTEQKRLLSTTLRLEREQGSDNRVALTLRWLSGTNRLLELYAEGIGQAKEALEIYERLGDVEGQAYCLETLAQLLNSDEQLDAAEEAATRAIRILPERGQEFLVCQSHRVLGDVYWSKSERAKAVHHFEAALGIASTFNWNSHQVFRVHLSLAGLALGEEELNNAQAHIERAKSHAVEGAHYLGCAMTIQALIWLQQERLGDARCEALGALEIFEKLGAGKDAEDCRDVLREIDHEMGGRFVSGEPDLSREFSGNDVFPYAR